MIILIHLFYTFDAMVQKQENIFGVSCCLRSNHKNKKKTKVKKKYKFKRKRVIKYSTEKPMKIKLRSGKAVVVGGRGSVALTY